MIIVSNKKIKNYQCYVLVGLGNKKYICVEKRHLNEYKSFIYPIGYMIKNKISDAFLKTKDNRVVLLSLDLKKTKSPVEISYLNLQNDEALKDKESLKLFIEVSKGKHYTYIDKSLEQLEKEVKFKIESNAPKIIAVIVILLAVLGGYLYHQKMEEQKYLELIMKTQKKKGKKLSNKEIVRMKEYISHKFIEKLVDIISNFKEYQKLSSLTLSYKSVMNKKTRQVSRIDGNIKYKIVSIYPVPGSIKNGDYYVVDKEEIIQGKNKPIKGVLDKAVCSEKLLEYGADLISLDSMKFTFKTDDYKKFIDALNYIYNCNFYFEGISMSANNYLMSVILK